MPGWQADVVQLGRNARWSSRWKCSICCWNDATPCWRSSWKRLQRHRWPIVDCWARIYKSSCPPLRFNLIIQSKTFPARPPSFEICAHLFQKINRGACYLLVMIAIHVFLFFFLRVCVCRCGAIGSCVTVPSGIHHLPAATTTSGKNFSSFNIFFSDLFIYFDFFSFFFNFCHVTNDTRKYHLCRDGSSPHLFIFFFLFFFLT